MTAATGNIAISSSAAYVTEAEWRAKTGISTTDESSTQFATDVAEAHFLVRRQCFHFVRERLIMKDSNLKAYLPIRWITDGNMDGSVDTSDYYVYQLSSDGLSLDAVDPATYISTTDAFNNVITFTAASSALTRQLYISYYACSKPFDEVTADELQRAVLAQTSVLVLERLRLKWGLHGTTGWSVPGVTVNKDLQSYKLLYDESKRELDKYVSFLRPFVGRKVRTGWGRYTSDPSVAYSSQVLTYIRLRR